MTGALQSARKTSFASKWPTALPASDDHQGVGFERILDTLPRVPAQANLDSGFNAVALDQRTNPPHAQFRVDLGLLEWQRIRDYMSDQDPYLRS